MNMIDLLTVLMTGALLGIVGTVLFNGIYDGVQDYLYHRRWESSCGKDDHEGPYDWEIE